MNVAPMVNLKEEFRKKRKAVSSVKVLLMRDMFSKQRTTSLSTSKQLPAHVGKKGLRKALTKGASKCIIQEAEELYSTNFIGYKDVLEQRRKEQEMKTTVNSAQNKQLILEMKLEKLKQENFMLKAAHMKKHIENQRPGEDDFEQELKDLEDYNKIFFESQSEQGGAKKKTKNKKRDCIIS